MPGQEALQRDGGTTQGARGRDAEPRPASVASVAFGVAPAARGASPEAPRPPSRRAQAALPLDVVSSGLAVRRIRVRPEDVVFVKGLVEASEGLAGVFAERGGELLLAAPREREAELCELLADLEEELRTMDGQGP